MRKTIALLTLTGLLAACGGTLPGVGYVGGGALPVDALSITSVDAETANVTYRVALRWPTAPGAKTYEVVRKFNDNPARVIASQGTPGYDDVTVGADQRFAFRVQAMSGEGKNLTSSDERAMTILKQEVGKPEGLEPAGNATIGVGEVPMMRWTPVQNATWYYVRVSRGYIDASVYAALTRNSAIKFGDMSPLKFEKFGDQFPTDARDGLVRGIVYRWSVSAIRADAGDDPAKVKAIDVHPSALQKFSQGV